MRKVRTGTRWTNDLYREDKYSVVSRSLLYAQKDHICEAQNIYLGLHMSLYKETKVVASRAQWKDFFLL